MQLPTSTLLLLTTLLSLASGTIHSGPAIQSTPKAGTLTARTSSTDQHFRALAGFPSSHPPHSLTRRQSDSDEEDDIFGDSDEQCYEKNNCDSLSDEHYTSCAEKAQGADDEDLDFGKCLCESDQVSKLIRSCSACYETPSKILEYWRDSCKTVNVNFDMNSAMTIARGGGMQFCAAAAAVAAVAVAAL